MAVDLPEVKDKTVVSGQLPIGRFRYGSGLHPPEGMTSENVYSNCSKCGKLFNLDTSKGVSESLYQYGTLESNPVVNISPCCKARVYTEAHKSKPGWADVEVYAFRIDIRLPLIGRVKLFKKNLPPIKFSKLD